VTYSIKPAKPTLNDSVRGGLVRFHVDKAGLYRVSITSVTGSMCWTVSNS